MRRARTIVRIKSLKLFLGSFRNHAGFHRGLHVGIGERLFTGDAAAWLRIGGYWYPRGGIPIDVFWQRPAPRRTARLLPQDVAGLSPAGADPQEQPDLAQALHQIIVRRDRLRIKIPVPGIDARRQRLDQVIRPEMQEEGHGIARMAAPFRGRVHHAVRWWSTGGCWSAAGACRRH